MNQPDTNPDAVKEGQEILERLRKIQDRELENALSVLRRLSSPVSHDTVSDGDLADAAFAFVARTDLANPVVPLMSHFIERFMVLASIEETPKGLKREYFAEGYEP